jgi:hypothetical protein
MFWHIVFRARARRAGRLLKGIDIAMSKRGASRAERRQFWRDFIKQNALRTEIFDGFQRAK